MSRHTTGPPGAVRPRRGSHPAGRLTVSSPAETRGVPMFIGFGTIVLIAIIVLVVLFIRRH